METSYVSPEVLIEKLKQTENDLDAKYQISLTLEPLIPQLTINQLFVFFLSGSESYRSVVFDQLKSNLSQLSPDQMLQLLPFQTQEQKEITVSALLTFAHTLSGHQLTQLHKYCTEDVRMTISNTLFENRKNISQEDLIYLAKESARSAPPEYHEILNQLLINEQKRIETNKPSHKCFGAIVPVQLQCASSTTSGQSLFHYFQPIDNDKFYLDITGPFSTMLKSGDISFEVIQTSFLSNQGAEIYLSVAPFRNAFKIGVVSPTKPVFHFLYPFQKLGIVETLRIGLVVKEILPKDLEILEVQVVKPETTETKNDLITVCFGEIHQFKIKDNDTMLTLLEFACRRFNQNIDQYEIQDLNYRTYPNQTILQSYLKDSGSAIVRLVKKNAWQQQPVNLFSVSPTHSSPTSTSTTATTQTTFDPFSPSRPGQQRVSTFMLSSESGRQSRSGFGFDSK